MSFLVGLFQVATADSSFNWPPEIDQSSVSVDVVVVVVVAAVAAAAVIVKC